MMNLTSMLETIMESGSSPHDFSDFVSPVLRQHCQLVHKHYTNEKFRETCTERFLALPNEIFMKSDERAERYRKNGNDFFNEKKYDSALHEYNEAVAVASWDTRPADDSNTELALAFSNRSMALLKMGRYKEALDNVELALMQAATEQLKKKLNFRKKECLGHLPLSSDNSESKNEPVNVTKMAWKDKSTCFAAEPLKKLDLVLREGPELSLLKKDFYFTRCYNCFEPFNLSIPCRGCNQVKFCSYTCATQAWNLGHHHFCLFLTLFDRLTNRDIFRVPPLLACQLILTLDLPPIFAAAREGSLPEDLDQISSTTLSDPEKLEKMAETAAHLLTYFTVIKRLPTKSDLIPWKYDIELFGGLLLMFIRKVEHEGRVVTSTELVRPLDDDEFHHLDEKVIGYAIYGQVKKLLHNCDPNVAIDVFNGRTLTLRAIKEIDECETIKLDVGVNCKLNSFKERSKYLSDHGFVCRCEACNLKIEPRAKAFLCPTCSGPVLLEEEANLCLDCGASNLLDRNEILTELDACLYNYRQANLALIHRERDIIKAEDYLLDCHRKLRKICFPTNQHLTDIYDRLSYCYKKMRKYKLSLIYGQQAVNCLDQSYHAFHKSRLNGFFNLLDRQRNYLTWCVRMNKTEEPEFHELFTETAQSIKSNLHEAQSIIKAINFQRDYYQSVINSIETSLTQHNLK